MLTLARVAEAQSALNFTPSSVPQAGIAVTNPGAYAADVRFTLFNSDGTPTSDGVTNNASYRIPARGQIAMLASEIFRMKPEASSTGWIQATSSVSGLQGFYFAGDYRSTFEGLSSAAPLTVQTILGFGAGSGLVLVTNPGLQAADAAVSFFDSSGNPLQPETFSLAPRAQRVLQMRGAAARISGSSGLLAVGVTQTENSLLLLNGQWPDSQSLELVAPDFRNETGVASTLLVTNPASSPVAFTVSFFNDSGELSFIKQNLSIPANGSANVSWYSLTASLNPPQGRGWLRVESFPTSVAGVVLTQSDQARTATPLQDSRSSRLLFARAAEIGGLTSRLTLVGDSESEAAVTVTLSRPDGGGVASNEIVLAPRERRSGRLVDLVPSEAEFGLGFVTVQSSVPIHAVETIDLNSGSWAAVTAQPLPAAYAPAIVPERLQIRATLLDELRPGDEILIQGQNLSSQATVIVGGRPVTMSLRFLWSTSEYIARIPDLEPGAVNVTVWMGGLQSNTEYLGVYSPDGSVTEDSPAISGYALFRKVEVADTGLDESRTSVVPIRNARVEVFERATDAVVSVSETDDLGRFYARVPDRSGLAVRIVSKLRYQDIRVLDNTEGDRLYSISRDIQSFGPLEIVETSRVSGAFNILDAVQRGNELIATADPRLVPPPVTIYWSTRNTNRIGNVAEGLVGTTYFNLADFTAYVLGDRTTDSDEFDDSVILHEYAHMLAARFSRDDSPGGAHSLGDVLDPRVAWSEGFANFFASAASGTPIYRDSKGPGVLGVRYDIEENIPATDRPGYWSEASVHGLLWDLIDENPDNGDNAQFPFASVWTAFTDLRNARFVYLPYFLEYFLERNPFFSDALRGMVILRGIDFQPNVRPSVTNPFPRTILPGETKTPSDVDSFTTRRTNLANSSHFYMLDLETGGVATIQLRIEGLGPANNPNANDLDLFLYDINGRRLDQSDRGLNGQSEIIPMVGLPPGKYVIEVRSFYRREETKAIVFNSGRYRLSVQMQ